MSTSRLWWQDVTPEAWRVFGVSDDLDRERHTAVLASLEELSTRAPMSTLDDIGAQMRRIGYHDPLPQDRLRETLDHLTDCKLIEPFRDYAATMSSVQAIRRRQEAWALTRLGRVVVAAVRTAIIDANRALQLPARLLDSVERTIRALLDHHATDPGLLPADLDDVRTRIDELQRVTADFYAALAQLVQADVTDDTLFGENRDRVVEALRQFPREYGRALARVERALTDLDLAGPRTIVEAASAHAGLLDGRYVQDWIDERVRRLNDLTAWFTADGTVSSLILNASGAVGTLLVAIDRRYTARRRGSDIGSDFHQLAHSIYRQVDDDAARGVWAAAFGDWPAHHPIVGPDAEHLAHTTTAANGATRHQVTVTLREHERHGVPGGRPHKVPDTTSARAQAIAEAHVEMEARRRLCALLVTDGEVTLRHFHGLESEAAAVLLRAIEAALQDRDPVTGIGEADAEAAAARVRVRWPDRAARTRIALADGILDAPDLLLQVTSTLSAQPTTAAYAAPDHTATEPDPEHQKPDAPDADRPRAGWEGAA